MKDIRLSFFTLGLYNILATHTVEEVDLLSMEEIIVRDASLKDAHRILEIYSYYIKNTAVTFEYEVPSVDDFRERMSKIMERYPYLVVERNGKVEGYAYAGPFIGRAACDWSCETTIYLDFKSCKGGLGRKLYEALERRLKSMGITNLYAAIAYPEEEDDYLNYNSANFHKHLGFKEVGRFHKCAYKFRCWYHLIWSEKIIGEHLDNQPDIKAYKI